MKTKVLIYCTKKTPIHRIIAKLCRIFHKTDFGCIGGKIVAECEVECEKIFQLVSWNVRDGIDYDTYSFKTNTLNAEELLNKSCINKADLEMYLLDYPQYLVEQPVGYALHISNLKVFDKPLELRDLDYAYEEDVFENMICDSCMSSKKCKDCYHHYNMRALTKAPQNMFWCWYKGERYCLISIRPEWVAKIANGEKDIEVRKKVLKGMM